MSDLLPSSVLLAIIQNQIKNAVQENNFDNSKFANAKYVENALELTQEEKNDISTNFYNFLIDNYTHSVFTLIYKNMADWTYITYATNYESAGILTNLGIKIIPLRFNYSVVVYESGLIARTDVDIDRKIFPTPENFIMIYKKYPGVIFYANYYSNTTDSIVYHFSSGIILDSTAETPQYKIVFAQYDVNSPKVTFTEKVLS